MHFYILILLFLFSCSDKKEVITVSGEINKVVRINDIESQVIKTQASEELIEVIIGPINMSNGELISESQQFKISSNDDLKIFEGNKSISEVAGDSSGFLKFKVKPPTKSGLYSVSIKGLNIDSVNGLIYIQVEASDIVSFGNVTTNIYEDLPPYNKLKDENEKYAAYNNKDTLITVGPFYDQYNNLKTDKKIEVFLEKSSFSFQFDEEGQPLTSKEIELINGYAYFYINTGGIGKNHQVTINIFDDGVKIKTATLGIIEYKFDFVGEVDFGTVFLGEEKENEFILLNDGNAIIEDPSFSINDPFIISGGSCQLISELKPEESCSLKIKVLAVNRTSITEVLKINLKVFDESVDEILYPVRVFSALPPSLKILSDLIIFEDQVVGKTAKQSFTVMNLGDINGINLRINQPASYAGFEQSFYTIRSPDINEPNDEPSFGKHCGEIIPPATKCRFIIEYTPIAQVGDIQRPATLIVDDSDPLVFFVKGASYINDYAENLPITLSKNELLKDNIDTIYGQVGVIRTNTNQVVPFGTRVELLFYQTVLDLDGETQKIYVGNFEAENKIIGSTPYINVASTNMFGIINFELKSRTLDNVGDFIIEARIVDSENRVLSKGFANGSMIGADLKFSESSVSFNSNVINNPLKKIVTLTNDGRLRATNIKANFRNNQYTISDELSCVGIIIGSLNLDASSTCQLELLFNPQQKKRYNDELYLTTDTIGSLSPLFIYGQGINPVKLHSETLNISETFEIDGEPLQKSITVSNVGDEDALDLKVSSILENQAFLFDYSCTNLIAGRNCLLTMEYLPINFIPFAELKSDLLISATGSDSGVESELKIPMTILHSSMKYITDANGINTGDCFALQVSAKEIDNDPLDHSNDIELNLSSNGYGFFYSNSNCTTLINSTKIPANTDLSEIYYYKPLESGLGTHTLRADTNTLASAVKSFKIYKEPTEIKIISGDSGSFFSGELYNEPISIKIIDEDGNGVPNIPVTFGFAKLSLPLNSNSTFDSDLAGWTSSSLNVKKIEEYENSVRISSNNSVEYIISEQLTLEQEQEYIINLKIKKITGETFLRGARVEVFNINDEVISSKELNKEGVLNILLQNPPEIIYIKVSNIGVGLNSYIYVDDITISKILSIEQQNNSYNGILHLADESFLQLSDTKGPGYINARYTGGSDGNESIINIYVNSEDINSSKVISINAEYPTKVKGTLGDLVISQSGFTLLKDGVDNSVNLNNNNFNWSQDKKTLTLDGKKTYDFNSITIEEGTKLSFNYNGTHGWTQLLSKENCNIHGEINTINANTNGSKTDFNTSSIDGEPLNMTIEDYLAFGGNGGNGGSLVSASYPVSNPSNGAVGTVLYGGNGGAKGFCPTKSPALCDGMNDKVFETFPWATGYFIPRTVTCQDSTCSFWFDGTNKEITLSYNDTTTPISVIHNGDRYVRGSYKEELPEFNCGSCGVLKSSTGVRSYEMKREHSCLKIQEDKNKKGGDGSGLFIKCNKNIDGEHGTINVSGQDGANGTKGSDGYNMDSYQQTPFCIAGGNGGNGGAPGGNGGSILLTFETMSNKPNINISAGNGGNGGNGGSGKSGLKYQTETGDIYGSPFTYWVNSTVNSSSGTTGSNGTSGFSGKCKFAPLVKGKIRQGLKDCSEL